MTFSFTIRMAAEPRTIMKLYMSCWLIFMLIAFADSYKYVNPFTKRKLCVVESVHTTKKILSLCPKLVKSPIECITETDRFGCLRQVMDGNADFTVLEPEELIAIRNYRIYSLLVTNELRLVPNEIQRFEMVVVANKNVQRIWDAKGKRFCHPGIDTVDDWTKAFSTFFENLVITRECNSNMTLFENRIHSLSKFFEMACIAGPWTSDTVFDYQLKSRYKNLCAACNNPVSCYNTDKYYGREGALLCLTDNVGDIAWVRLKDARVHFKAEMIDTKDYKFLCPDGTTKPLNFNQACVWISKPWPVIVARSRSGEDIARLMNSMLNMTFNWESNVLQLMENYDITSANIEDLETPADYLHRFPSFMSANVRSGCQPSRTVRWCLASDLDKFKCSWLRDTNLAYGVEPMISCFHEHNKDSCLEAIRNGEMDIFLARPDDLFDARMKGLKPIIHAMTNTKHGLNRIAAVVMRNSTFTVLKDLEGARAVFTGYRSVGWNAFVTLMRNESNGKWDCSDAQAVAKFFRNSCVLGWNGVNNDQKLPANLYSLCKEGAERANDDLRAFEYLNSGLVDVAFVNLKVVENSSEVGDFYYEKIDHKNINRMPKYRTLGPTLAEAIKGVPYLLAWTTLGSIIAHENITDLRRQEIYMMLLEMDKLFGQKFFGQTPAFSLYGSYATKPGVLFPEDTQYLELHGHQVLRGRNYNQIVEDMVKQGTCNSGATRTWSFHFLGIYICNYLCLILVVSLSRLLITN